MAEFIINENAHKITFDSIARVQKEQHSKGCGYLNCAKGITYIGESDDYVSFVRDTWDEIEVLLIGKLKDNIYTGMRTTSSEMSIFFKLLSSMSSAFFQDGQSS